MLPNKFIIAFSLLLITSLACGLGRQSSGSASAEVAPPEGQIVVSQEAADRFKQNFNQALQETTVSHEAQLRITNAEITSIIATELSQTGQIPVNNPQVWFTAGRIYMTGEVSAFGLTNDATIIATPLVQDGRIVVEVQEAKMGLFDFPESMLESLTQTVNDSLANTLIDIQITRLEVLEGEMIVIGTRRAP